MKIKPVYGVAYGAALVLVVVAIYYGTGLSGRKAAYHKLPPLPTALKTQITAEKGAGDSLPSNRRSSPSNRGFSFSGDSTETKSTLTDAVHSEGNRPSAPASAAIQPSKRRQSPGQRLNEGLNPVSGNSLTAGSNTSATQARLPLVLLDPDPSLNFSAGQLERLKNLRQSFIDEVGGLNQDPASPAYLEAWQNAQWKSDQLYKTLYGWKAYNLQLLRATQEAGNYQPE